VWIRWIARAVVVLAALVVCGCTKSPGVSFRLNMDGRAEEEVSVAQRQAGDETLEEIWGTADEPRAPEGVGLDGELLTLAAGAIHSTKDGIRYGLYRDHCAVCHGISGDGAGLLATTFDPYPRDFRSGTFKYTSTRAGLKPLFEDLRRIMVDGIPGSGMPAFAKLPESEIEALVEYTKYLSMRGQTELYLMELVVDEDEYLPLGVDALEAVMEDGVLYSAGLWTEVEERRGEYVIVPPPPPRTDTPELWADSVAMGRELYAGEDAKCVECHGPDGAGDGENTDLYDDWNKPKEGVTSEKTAERAKLYALAIQRLRARDFRRGNFRGGSRPEDLYLRIHAGIKGTPMPTAGPSNGSDGAYTEGEIWHVVNYVLSLAGIEER
jgi:mono/diheme cytochrome c family protein